LTVRSVIAGLFATALLCGCCYFNDTVIRAGSMVSSLMPVVAYGGVLLFLLFLNPLLQRLGRRAAFSGRETAAMLALFLIACGIPGWGLVQLFPMTVMMPHHDVKVRPGWQEKKVTERTPPQMLTDVSSNESEALDGYVTGLAEGDSHIAFSRVPWYAWRRTFLFWGPLVISMLIAVMGLAAVFHQQWVHHEQLPYPIPVFVNSLLPDAQGRLNQVFRNRVFWIGFAVSFLILMNNYLCRWWPNVLIPVSTRLNFGPLMKLLPVIVRGKGTMLFYPRIILPVVGLAYLIGSDVSISMALAPWLYCLVAGIFAGYGVHLRSGKMMALTMEPFIFAGGYFGILSMVLYTGRRYYLSAFLRGIGVSTHDQIPAHAITGARMFMGGIFLFIIQLVLVGLDWQIAIIYTFFAVMIYVVVSRSIAETGAFHVGTFVYPGIMVWGMFGEKALGPTTLAIMFLVSTVLLAAPGWCPMPFIVQALKLADLSKVRVSHTVKWGTAALLIGLFVAVPATIYWQYDRGAPTRGWPRSSSVFPLENVVEIVHKLEGQGSLEAATTVKGWARFQRLQPSGTNLLAFAITAGLALAVGFGRLRFAHWPIHPVIFIFFGGHQGMLMYLSFGLGWLIKNIVTKYGGAQFYHQLRPGMIGLIAGAMMARFLPMIIGMIHYFVTGNPA